MDREKVITEIEDALSGNLARAGHVYRMSLNGLKDKALTDALAMLKEQEAVKPVLDGLTGRIWLCGNCGSYVGFEDNDPYDPNEFYKYCCKCGRPVLWEDQNSERKITDIDCPKCGKKIYVRTDVILFSYPSKSQYECDCGWVGYN